MRTDTSTTPVARRRQTRQNIASTTPQWPTSCPLPPKAAGLVRLKATSVSQEPAMGHMQAHSRGSAMWLSGSGKHVDSTSGAPHQSDPSLPPQMRVVAPQPVPKGPLAAHGSGLVWLPSPHH